LTGLGNSAPLSTPPPPKPEAVLANWLKIQTQNPKDTHKILKIVEIFELTIKIFFWIFNAKVSVVVWKWASVFKRAFILRFCKEKLFKSESVKHFILCYLF
jgi:hypothetical protein